MKHFISDYKGFIYFLVFTLAIAGIVFSNKISKRNEQNKLIENRKATCARYDEKIPEIILAKCEGISNASVSTSNNSQVRECTDYDGKPDYYYIWVDQLNIACIGDESFSTGNDKYKLSCMQKIYSTALAASSDIRENEFPFYHSYYNRDEIVNLFDKGVFCETEMKLYIVDGADTYEYEQYKNNKSDKYKKNEQTVYLSNRSFSDYATYTCLAKGCSREQTDGSQYCTIHTCHHYFCNNYVSGAKYCEDCRTKDYTQKKKIYDYQHDVIRTPSASTQSSKSDNAMPDCDDYDSYDDFMDDWDGNMPDGSDAEDYWENW